MAPPSNSFTPSSLVALLLLSVLAASCAAQTVYTLPGHIRSGRRVVDIKPFAQLPTRDGRTANIVSMTQRGRNLFVVDALGSTIYRVTEAGAVSLWFNVSRAVLAATNGERNTNTDTFIYGGVRSVAFHPSYPTTGLFYVSMLEDIPSDESGHRYLSTPNGGRRTATADSVVAEFKYDRSRGRIDPMSYRVVLRVMLPRLEHPIRQMIFIGRNLVIGHGDGSQSYHAFVDTIGGGQRNDALGKIIRINPLRTASGRPYSVPRNNPWRGRPEYLDELYAVGVRNPHNLCYSARYGLFVADAGRNNVEEINRIEAGRNYGWERREGTFVHMRRGGIVSGVGPLPDDDARFNYTYPVAMFGHAGDRGQGTSGHAIAGACPVENDSALRGLYLYANFPDTGEIYYSHMGAMMNAVTQGPPDQLTQARTYRAVVTFDDDGLDSTPSLPMANFRALVRRHTGDFSISRADIRFGRGRQGQLYISSKSSGHVYIIKTSEPGSRNA